MGDLLVSVEKVLIFFLKIALLRDLLVCVRLRVGIKSLSKSTALKI